MPVIGISVERLAKLLKSDVPLAEVEVYLGQLGCDVDGVVDVRRFKSRFSDYVIELTPAESLPLTDPLSGRAGTTPEEVWEPAGGERVVRLDLLPVRPDLFDAGGLARALRGYLGRETGLKDYAAAAPSWRVEVDPRITDPAFRRPLIQCAIVRGLTIDDETLRAIMKLQENLHWALCRDRKFASIGAYDLDTLANPIRYTLVDRERFRFTPLFWGGREPVSPQVMLAEHPKGTAYAHLLDGLSELPALLAANDRVLSLPPVINAEETKLTTATRNVLLDVTGHNLPIVTRALAILATSLVELDPAGQATIERVEMVYPDRTLATPELKVEEFSLDPDATQQLLGLPIDRAACVALLEKMRYGVRDSGSGPLTVLVPAYRNDIMHAVDLVEDVAIAYGYHRIEPELVPTFTAGEMLPLNVRSRRAAQALCGLGFMETMNLVLTSEEQHYTKLRREPTTRRVRVANPASGDQTMLREHLYASLLELLSLNTDHPLPQRIFEVGDAVRYCPGLGPEQPLPAAEPEPLELRLIAGVVCATRAGYALGRSVLDALCREMGHGADGAVEYRADDNPTAIPGRAAAVYVPAGASGPLTGLRIAEVFEVHPEVLEKWGLSNPVVMFSLLLGHTS